MNNFKLTFLLHEILCELRQINKNTQKKTIKKPTISECPFDLELAYKRYPKKEGKTKGMATLAKQIKTRSDYDKLLIAIDNYTNKCRREKTEKKFIKQFSTFANCWQDYLQNESQVIKPQVTYEEPTGFLS